MSNLEFERERPAAPRVVVVGLASCFGCQLQITNAEPYLLDVLDQIDLRYWQLASSDPMPEEFDVAVIEGAATTAEAIETLKAVRKKASAVIAVGACATTAGIPGMAAGNVEAGAAAVYGEAGAPEACGELVDPAPISAYIDVDFEVLCCPIDTFAFIDVLQRAIYGSNRLPQTATLCGECKHNDRGCFFGRGILCLGLVAWPSLQRLRGSFPRCERGRRAGGVRRVGRERCGLRRGPSDVQLREPSPFRGERGVDAR